eukprot:6234391-Pyramimonas_sp.AAC.1
MRIADAAWANALRSYSSRMGRSTFLRQSRRRGRLWHGSSLANSMGAVASPGAAPIPGGTDGRRSVNDRAPSCPKTIPLNTRRPGAS